ncbi:MAG: FAD-dependent oxidoreductase [Bacteroidetes bacterium]|nr:FAD-dependent oxidoreductase [Bacteroidota bacterium]
MAAKLNIVVVGGNAAGPAAAAKAKRVNPSADVSLYEAGEFISTGTCELPYLISGHIKNYRDIVFFSPESFFEKKGVRVFTMHLVERIDRKNKIILIRSLMDQILIEKSYDKLILTTGSSAKKLQSVSSELANVFSFKTVSDFIKIEKYRKENSVNNVLIIGAGYIGLEAAENCKLSGMEVTIIEKEKNPMPSAGIELQELIKKILADNRIEFYGNSENPEFIISGNKIASLKIDGWKKPVDLALLSLGVEPNNILAQSAGLSIGKNGGLLTDNKLKTSDPNIFAAGDNIEVKNFLTNNYDYMPLAGLAHKYGHIAGENAAGGNAFVYNEVKNAAFKLFDNTIAGVGLTKNELENMRIKHSEVYSVLPNLVKVMPESRNTFAKIYYNPENRRIFGAEFLGGNEVIGYADLISAFIRSGITADKLKDVNYSYTPPCAPFVNILSALGRKIN